MYETADGDLAFGDIFAADWFFSAYLRKDAIPLVEFTPSKPTVSRAWTISKPSEHRDYLFAHGLQRQAILLADECEAETVVKRRGAGRLVFAAIERLPIGPSEQQRVLKSQSFRVFPLSPGDGYSGGSVQFQQLFAMAVEGVVPENGSDPRVARLSKEMRRDLEMRWAAYATRRGPLTHIDNGEKLARVLSGESDAGKLERLRKGEEAPEAEHIEIGRELARALGWAWEIEGAALNDVADVLESGGSADVARGRLVARLKELAATSQRSAALLEATGPSPAPGSS